MKHFLLPSAALLALSAQAGVIAHVPFELQGSQVAETVSGLHLDVNGHFAPESVAGAVGNALRLDGYTTEVGGHLAEIVKDASALTISVWCAVEAYPIVGIDQQTNERVPIADLTDTASGTGFAINLGIHGKWDLTLYPDGWPVTIEADKVLPRGQWVNITAVLNSDDRKIRLYMNGELVKEQRCNGSLSVGPCEAVFGHSRTYRGSGAFRTSSFSGIIDDLTIWNEAKPETEIASWKPENTLDFAVHPSRFEGDLLRPRFHGMPSAGWTNESHGMLYGDGRYHVFFQKNPNGPYMARLHWGHISSPNLFDWHEEPIAIAPQEDYDIKGCWSGAVFTDPVVTGGKPAAIYTAVDYARAVIAQATSDDVTLNVWDKRSNNPIINGRPSGLSDDFRDPYFFRNGDNAYIIVGSSRDGKGTATLHRYNAASDSWSNDGAAFFNAADAQSCGTFWEMPNVTRMGDRWLFTCTPLGTSRGVRTIYFTGQIADDGHFVPDAASAQPRLVEMVSHEGFGMLSPTILQHDGKTIALGIVPDKLPGNLNANLGWAHTYSLPREWSLDSDGNLLQRPFEGLENMRSTSRNVTLPRTEMNGRITLDAVAGRAVEVRATFEAGSSPCGISLFGNDNGEAKITFNPADGTVTADFTSLTRYINDGYLYDGIYTCVLPQSITRGEEVTLDVFADHSILDIFVNDKWATSIRVFPTDTDADRVAIIGDNGTVLASASAWALESDPAGIAGAAVDSESLDGLVVSLDGTVLGQSSEIESLGLSQGVYIVNGRKRMLK